MEKDITTMTLPRMRTISEVYKHVKTEDAGSSITEYRIRRICIENKVRHIKIGVKYLVDLDSFIEYINNIVGTI